MHWATRREKCRTGGCTSANVMHMKKKDARSSWWTDSESYGVTISGGRERLELVARALVKASGVFDAQAKEVLPFSEDDKEMAFMLGMALAAEIGVLPDRVAHELGLSA